MAEVEVKEIDAKPVFGEPDPKSFQYGLQIGQVQSAPAFDQASPSSQITFNPDITNTEKEYIARRKIHFFLTQQVEKEKVTLILRILIEPLKEGLEEVRFIKSLLGYGEVSTYKNQPVLVIREPFKKLFIKTMRPFYNDEALLQADAFLSEKPRIFEEHSIELIKYQDKYNRLVF